MVSTRTLPCPAIAQDDLTAWLGAYETLHIDIGTGDGAFALTLARRHPGMAVLGIDTCLDNLTKPARKPPANLRFLACDATGLPALLDGTATSLSINFPYGSLFHLVTAEGSDTGSWIRRLARPGARVDLRVNESAGVRYGMPLETIRHRVDRLMRDLAPGRSTIVTVPHGEMRTFPSTWAKRLAWGRPGQVVIASGQLVA